MLDFIASSALRPASFTAAAIKSSSSSRSLHELPIAVGSIFTRITSFFPFIRTVTTPPPLEASTTVAASFFSICSCISFACPIISFIFPRSEKSIITSLVVLSQIDHRSHLSIEQRLRSLHNRMFHRLRLRTPCLRCPRLLHRSRLHSRKQHKLQRTGPNVPQRSLHNLLCLRVDHHRQHRLRKLRLHANLTITQGPLSIR